MKTTHLALMLGFLIAATLSQNIIMRNPGCNSYDQNGVCKSCAMRYYRDKNNICQPVNPNCKTFDEISGDCLSCYPGFGLIQGTCLPGLATQTALDPNCNRFESNACVKCSHGYYFNPAKICAKADPNCQTFNQLNGDCTSCYSGFALNMGKCNRSAAKAIDFNCNQFNENGACVKCSTGFYFRNNLCTKVDDSCKEFNFVRGVCVACYPGYSLNNLNNCMQEQIKVNLNPYCAQWSSDICLSCAKGSIFNQAGICTLLDSNCRSFNEKSGACTGCYSGYNLQNGSCNKAVIQSVSDSNCNQFSSNGQCTKCSIGYYFNDLKICTKVDDNCKSFSIQNRRCMDCYPGYQLNMNAQCIKAIQEVTDPNCAEWNSKVCSKCSVGAVFNQNGICSILDPQCRQYNSATRLCMSCYAGYQLNNRSVCVRSAVQTVRDALCAQWIDQKTCAKCSVGSFFGSNGLCTLINSDCRQANQVTGKCLSCYDGYSLNADSNCVKEIQQNTDENCAQWSGKVCLKCSVGSTFNNQRQCVVLDALCKKFDPQLKLCLNCYAGYELNSNRVCILSAIKEVRDSLCAQWSGDRCMRCASKSFFNADKVCVSIDSTCKTANNRTGACLSCYDGYQLSNGACSQVIEQLSDLNCAEWNNKICLKCSFGAAFNNMGKCIVLDAQCKQYDQFSGLCQKCYAGYELNNQKICTRSAVSAVKDALCSQWSNDICRKCSTGSFFSSNGICTQVNPSCKSANPVTGLCLACYDGYQLNSQNSCIKVVENVSDVNCAQWKQWNKVCAKCSVGANFDNFGKCVLFDSQCKTYDTNLKVCRSCYAGYNLNSLNFCVKSAVEAVRDALCAEWNGDICLKCSSGTLFNSQGICAQIDPLCRSFNQRTGECLSCYAGFQLSNTKICTKATKGTNNNLFCAQWDGQICLKCSSGSFFNGLGICEVVDPLCKSSNALSGACTSCFNGYRVSGSKCVAALQQSRDLLCQQFDGLICIKCSFGAYFNSRDQCQLSDSLCSKFNTITGACTSCYPGHVLIQGKCQVDLTHTVSDPFCAQFNKQICVQCAQGYYFQRDGKCTIVDPLCNTFNKLNGACLSCFTGYELKSGMCLVAAVKATDPNCASFNGEVCSGCSKGFIFNQNRVCVVINPLCRTFDELTGACKTCYGGYAISGATCIIDINSLESNCAESIDNICIRCASRTFMNFNGQCQKVSQDCRTYNDFNGLCLSCYSGYSLNKGQCLKDLAQGGCSQLDSNGICVKCGIGFYLDNGKCSQFDSQCAKFNFNSKKCEGCYSGYTLLQGKCEIAKVNQELQVKNCIAYNNDSKCIQCFDRFYLSNNQCKQVSVFCKTYDLITGSCTGCYSTFKLANSQCKQQA